MFVFWIEHGRHDLPRRQPAHQAVRVLGVVHRAIKRAPPRGDLPRRGVHPPEADVRAREARASPSRTPTSPGGRPSPSSTQYLPSSRATEVAEFFRPNFWPNTPDILPEHLQHGGRAAFVARLVLAHAVEPLRHLRARVRADGARRARPGAGEYARQREVRAQALGPRRARQPAPRHRAAQPRSAASTRRCSDNRTPALPRDRQRALLCYSKQPPTGDIVLVVVNLDPHHTPGGLARARSRRARPRARRAASRSTTCSAAAATCGAAPRNYVELDPDAMPAHVFAIRRRVRTERDFDYFLMSADDRCHAPTIRPAHDDPLWYKDAIIYELHVRAFARLQRRRHRRLRRADREARLPRRTSASRRSGCCRSIRRRCATAATTSPTTRGVHPELRHASRDFKRLLARGPPPRHPRDHRAGASTTPRSSTRGSSAPAARRRAVAHRDFYVWSDTPERYERRPHHLPGLRDLELDLGPGRQRVLLAPLLLAPARPQLRQPRGPARRCFEVVDFWLDAGRRRPAARRRAVPVRARGHQLREPARDPRVPQASCARTSTRKYPNRMLLAEANQWPEDAAAYFGDGDECHMNFHFPLMPRMFMALQLEDRFPIVDILQQTPQIPDDCQWAIVPAQPRRAHARDGHRRGPRLHVPRLRRRPADARQPRHPPPARAAARRPRARSS